MYFFFFQAEDGIRDWSVTGVQTCALPIFGRERRIPDRREVRAEAGGAVFVHGIPREVSLPPDATDFLRDLKRDRNVFSDPRRDVADLPDGFDEDVVFLEIDEPPRGPAHDEALPELRILRHEPP